jgi:hypothetical protein
VQAAAAHCHACEKKWFIDFCAGIAEVPHAEFLF